MFDIREKLSTVAGKVLKEKFALSTVVHFDVPIDPSKGDLTTSAALQLAKKVGKQPREIADALAKGFTKVKGVDSVSVAGAGYVNVFLLSEVLIAGLDEAWTQCEPLPKHTKEAPIIIEYSHPNIAKPLGIHNVLSTIIGQVISNLYEHLGYNIVRVNHFGDWGTQFGKLAVAMEKWGTKPAKECSVDELLSLYVRFHQEAEKDPTLEDLGREAFRKIEQGDPELRAFWKDVVEVTMAALDTLYKRLHVHIEHPHGEAMYEKMMAPILEEGLKKGVFKEGEKGAIVVEFPEEKKIPTAVVQKGDSASIYMTRDFAQIRYRIDRWHPSHMYYVVDVAQSLHFKQLFETVKMLGWELPHLEHIAFGRMRFADKAMSTRKGIIIKLEEALDEGVARAGAIIKQRGDAIQTDDPTGLAEMMGVGALVYGVLSQNRKMDMVFDWDKMLSFEGNSAPYVQYTYARAQSVLRKAGAKTFSVPAYKGELSGKERQLLHLLLRFSQTIESARADHLPHKLSTYLYELCQAYNSFYNAEVILKAEGSARDARIALTHVTARILKTGAELLTMRVPDRM